MLLSPPFDKLHLCHLITTTSPQKAFRCSTCLWPQECSNLQDKYKKVICDPAAVLRHQEDCCFHLFSSILKLILFPSVLFFSLLFVYKRFLFRYLTVVKIFLWEMCPNRQTRKNSVFTEYGTITECTIIQNVALRKAANKAVKTQSWEKLRLGETECHECREGIR